MVDLLLILRLFQHARDLLDFRQRGSLNLLGVQMVTVGQMLHFSALVVLRLSQNPNIGLAILGGGSNLADLGAGALLFRKILLGLDVELVLLDEIESLLSAVVLVGLLGVDDFFVGPEVGVDLTD